ncbi:biopolymer transporter ExbD [Opitutaceae bacterium EW11]|nr:biopolymer transporter ExbD [Opitutaceae bacterium EW11]
MAGSSGGSHSLDGPKKARIEIIPLIDVIFFLLATFVLFTLSLNKIQSLPIDLPAAKANAAPNPEDDTVILQVSEAGSAYWNRELIPFSEIAPRLQNYKATSPNPHVLITGDDRAKVGATIKAFDEVRKSGIKQVSIETIYRASGR